MITLGYIVGFSALFIALSLFTEFLITGRTRPELLNNTIKVTGIMLGALLLTILL